MDNNPVKRLLKIIEDQLGWGNPESWPSRDFEELNILIQEKTKVSLSSSTLRRLWGKADYKNQPSLTTLDTLAQFGGFENWKSYCLNEQPLATTERLSIAKPFKSKKRWLSNAWVIVVSASLLLIAMFLLKTIKNKPVADSYAFSSHPVTHDLPNTVVFTYNAKGASTDSVFIQQSWDSKKKARVDRNKHVLNSIYYKPGFYHAKLTVGNRVVKEHPLLIPSNGWLGLIDQAPVPVYLTQKEFIAPAGILLNPSAITSHHISLEPQPPTIEFYNTGNFQPVSILDFSFSTEVKNDYKTGASRCQQTKVMLFTNNIPISIPLSAPGCIASLNLLDGNKEYKGTDTDLTGFGIDPSNWVKVALISKNGKISVTINHKKVFEITISDRSAKILGLGFVFQGSAAIRRINLASGNKPVFSAFNE